MEPHPAGLRTVRRLQSSGNGIDSPDDPGYTPRRGSPKGGRCGPRWRNWQTRYLEVVVLETGWRFESSPGHCLDPIGPPVCGPFAAGDPNTASDEPWADPKDWPGSGERDWPS